MTNANENPEQIEGLRLEDPGFRRVLIAVLFAGLASFQAFHATQALLSTLSDELSIDPATVALTVSAITGGLAYVIIPVSILSERFGRRRVIVISAFVATLLGFVVSIAPGIGSMITLRLLQGIVIAGVPTVAMVYVSEEIHTDHVSHVVGPYISGTIVDGLPGRIIPSIVLEFAFWRMAIAVSATVAFISAVLTWYFLPQQRRLTPRQLSFAGEGQAIARHLRDPRILVLCVLVFLSMESFISLYNYLGFRLGDRFGLSPAPAGFIFILYLSGTWSSARAGVWAKMVSRRRLITIATLAVCVGLRLALLPWLPALIVSVLIFTASFFVTHSLSSSGVGLVVQRDRAEASSMYLFSYYAGSSIVGWVSGIVFSRFERAGLIPWLVVLSFITDACAVTGLKPRRQGAMRQGIIGRKAHSGTTKRTLNVKNGDFLH